MNVAAEGSMVLWPVTKQRLETIVEWENLEPVCSNLLNVYICKLTASVVWWSEFPAAEPEVLGLIPDANRFSEK
jgi:hypothetical protein